MTSAGGPGNLGTVFQITPQHTEKVIYSFTGSLDGSVPRGSLLQASDGRLYGFTSTGGDPTCQCGTIFSVTPDGQVDVLHAFTGVSPDGRIPNYESFGHLIQANDGNLYGMTNEGGTSNGGTIVQVSLTGTVSTLYSFSYSFLGGIVYNGEYPEGSLVQGSDGSLYGLTTGGGGRNDGVIFKFN